MSIEAEIIMLSQGRVTSFEELSQKTVEILGKRATKDLYKELVEIAQDFRGYAADIMKESPPGFVRLTRSGKQDKRNKKHAPSIPGNPPRPDTGMLRKTLAVSENRFDLEVEFGSPITKPPYPLWLEQGTKFMEPRPWLDPTIQDRWPEGEKGLLNVLEKAARDYVRSLG